MENRKKFHPDDFLDRAVDAVLSDPPPEELPPDRVAQLVAVVRQAADRPHPITLSKRTGKMKRIAKLAVAATVLATIVIFVFWMTGGGSDNIAFARVADALDNLRSATFDITSETKGEKGQPPAVATGKGFFLAPLHQRMEITSSTAKYASKNITIVDGQTAKCTTLHNLAKTAVVMDLKNIRKDMRESGLGALPDMFEVVRQLVREGSSGTNKKAERLGRKKIAGHEAVGFRIHANRTDMTLWADPETAQPIRIKMNQDMMPNVCLTLDNFRYNVDLDPSLFSLEPPEGYSVQTIEMTMPVEADLLRTLRTVAGHSESGVFPAKLEMNEEVIKSVNAALKPALKSEQDELNAEMNKLINKLVAKYGGREKFRAKHGKELPPAFMKEYMKAAMPLSRKLTQKRVPLMQKELQGIQFYTMLKPENDPHYVGGVKLGTPDRAILWYKPTGARNYRVIYADLRVKEVSADKLPKEQR